MSDTKESYDWQEPNIALTMAEMLKKDENFYKQYEKMFLELTDLAFEYGCPPEKIEIVAEQIGFSMCVWCREKGLYPSAYFKSKKHFTQNGRDEQLSGKICDECLKDLEKEDSFYNWSEE